jgi:hypothetical protein
MYWLVPITPRDYKNNALQANLAGFGRDRKLRLKDGGTAKVSRILFRHISNNDPGNVATVIFV